MLLTIISIIFVSVFLSGCVGQTKERTEGTSRLSPKETAISECKALCESALERGEDLSNGPCLANELEGADGWVCDVAHSPRQAVDNDPSNQCSAYRAGVATHFVEVDTNCELIRAI